MIVSILIFLVVLSILVLVHELGHFIVAKKAGVWVEEFGFGLPPRVWGKKIGETLYSINALPFGGFVKLHGEEDEGVDKPNLAFLSKDKKTRTAIVISGVLMNFLLGVIAFSVVYSFLGIPKTTGKVKIVDITSDSPAKAAGLVVGDVVKSVDGVNLSSVSQFVKLVEEKKGKRINLEVARDGSLVKVNIVPRTNPPEGEGPLGVAISDVEIYYPPVWQRPFYGAVNGVKEALFWGKTVVDGFVKVIGDLIGRRVPEGVAGPVGIFAVTTEATKEGGILGLINIIGILSINLGIINIVPFPALDGGRLLFIGIEAVLGRRVVPKVETFVHTIGMIILLLLLLAITAHDIQSIIAAGGLTGFINSVLK